MDVIGMGNLNYDVILLLDKFPEFHEKMEAKEAYFGLGGAAANTISWLAHFGVKSGYIGAVGNDEIGKAHLEYFKRIGVDTGGIRVVGEPSGVAISLVHGEDKRIIKYPGANRFRNFSKKYAKKGKHLHLSSNPPYLVEKAVKFARVTKKTISLDIGEATLPSQIESLVDYLLMNEDEYRRKFGKLDLHLSRAKNVIVTLNGGGALVRDEQGNVFEIRGLSARVIDSTGAGDAFDAGVIYGIIRRWDIVDSAKLGMLLAYLTVQKIGARSTIVTFDEVKKIAENLKLDLPL